MKFLISVIVPCYNQAEFLSHALKSVYDQTYENWECIIINDGSTDKTEIVSRDWCRKDPRFRYFYKENGGLSSARNLGLEKSRGKILQFLDADDFVKCTKFEKCLDKIWDNKDGYTIAVTDFLIYSDKKKVYQPPYCSLSEELINYNTVLFNWDENFSIPIHCAMFDINLFQNFRFPESIKSKEDWIMWINLLQQNVHIIYINEALAVYRKHDKSMTMASGIFEQHMLALEYLRNIIPTKDYIKLLEAMMKRYYQSSLRFKTELHYLQSRNFYKFFNSITKLPKRLELKFSTIKNRWRS